MKGNVFSPKVSSALHLLAYKCGIDADVSPFLPRHASKYSKQSSSRSGAATFVKRTRKNALSASDPLRETL